MSDLIWISNLFDTQMVFLKFSKNLVLKKNQQMTKKHEKISKEAKINLKRTSDSLNEGLPIKMTREKFQRK